MEMYTKSPTGGYGGTSLVVLPTQCLEIQLIPMLNSVRCCSCVSILLFWPLINYFGRNSSSAL